MKLEHIVVAADESDAGRAAFHAGLDLARRASARLTVMRTVPASPALELASVAGTPVNRTSAIASRQTALEHLRQWVMSELPPATEGQAPGLAVTYGLPGVEIGRFAESEGASLVVLGRKPRTSRTRLLLGDTADAVARRSRLPCLFVQPGARPIRDVLAAGDGTDRGLSVITDACAFATGIGAELRIVTVERVHLGEPAALAVALPSQRSARLRAQIDVILGPHCPDAPLDIRRGAVVEQVLAAVEDTGSDALVVGYHRGGPPGIIDAGSVARRLVHTAGCAVLTIPL
jgi:nucleotide-binding universal stress UspA family protein